MEQKYIKGDIVMYDNRIHTIMDTLELNNYELSYISHPVHQLELSGVPLTLEILEKNGWKTQNGSYYFLNVAKGFISYIGIDFKHKSDKGQLYVEIDECDMIEIQNCHQLQHFLFGLGLNSEMEV